MTKGVSAMTEETRLNESKAEEKVELSEEALEETAGGCYGLVQYKPKKDDRRSPPTPKAPR